jgi:hypothetical protein
LSNLKHFILCPIWTSTITLNFVNTSFFCFKKLNKVHFEWSSINFTKYCDSLIDFFYIEPYTSKCTNIDNWVVLFPPLVGNFVLNYFPYKQLWHKCISSGLVLILKPWTKDLWCINFTFWMPTWPNLLCHNYTLVHLLSATIVKRFIMIGSFVTFHKFPIYRGFLLFC